MFAMNIGNLTLLSLASICALIFPPTCRAQDDADTWNFKEAVEIGGSEAQALRSLEVFARRLFETEQFDRALQVLAEAEKQAKEKWPFIVVQCWKAKFLEAQGKVADANALMDKLGERVKDMPVKGNDAWEFDQLVRAMPRGWRNARLKELGCDLEGVGFVFTLRDASGVPINVAFDCGNITDADFPETQHIRITPERPPPGAEAVTQELSVATTDGATLKFVSIWGSGQRRPHNSLRIMPPEKNRAAGTSVEIYTIKANENELLAVAFEFKDGKVEFVRLDHLINFWKAKK
jgi:hypothetical protein